MRVFLWITWCSVTVICTIKGYPYKINSLSTYLHIINMPSVCSSLQFNVEMNDTPYLMTARDIKSL